MTEGVRSGRILDELPPPRPLLFRLRLPNLRKFRGGPIENIM